MRSDFWFCVLPKQKQGFFPGEKWRIDEKGRVVRSAVGANSNATGVLELMDDTRSFALALLEDCNK